MGTEVLLLSPRPGRIVRRVKTDFGRRFTAGEPVRALKADPAFLALREELSAAILATDEEGALDDA